MKFSLNLFIFLNSTVCFCGVFSDKVVIDFDRMNTTQIIAAFGYPVEIHELITDDGYILKHFRIPYGRKSVLKQPNKYPVLLHHGLMSSAECFLFGVPHKTLAYYLADHGFDVWLINDRGTMHSRKHVKFDPDIDEKFWKYTFHEIAIFDVANTIDHILNVTQQRKLFYIGHSQGGTTGLLLLAEKPEYNEKIWFLEAMSPGVIFEHLRQPLVKAMAPYHEVLKIFAESLSSYELLPRAIISNDQFRKIARILCGHNGYLSKELCVWIISFGTNSNVNQIDRASVPFVIASPIGGASLYQGIHFLQLIEKNELTQMDWSAKENLKRYNSTAPPDYNLTRVTCPVGLMYGLDDSVVTAEDTISLSKVLPNVADLYQVPYENWSHLDYFWAKNLKSNVLDHLLDLMNKYIT